MSSAANTSNTARPGRRYGIGRVRRAVWQRPPPVRPLVDFSRDLRFGEGWAKGRIFRPESHPAQLEVLTHLDDPRYSGSKILKPAQDGGTWCGQLVPTLWLLFECRDPVVYGGPDMTLLGRLWSQKIRPTIEGSPWAHLLPAHGKGSRGGDPEEITFANGVPLSFIGAGAKNEAAQAAISARGIFTDEYDSIAPYRRRLIKARGKSYGPRVVASDCSTLKEALGESLLTIEYETESTASRLAYRCPHTGWYRFLEWDDDGTTQRQKTGVLGGAPCWIEYDNTSAITARATARLVFDHFGERIEWTEQDRQEALKHHLLVHKGQQVMHSLGDMGHATAARINGPHPETDIFGIRWTALDSPYRDIRELAVLHRRAVELEQAGDDSELANFERDELVRRYIPKYRADDGELSPQIIARRITNHPRGTIPSDALGLTIGIDPGGARTGVHWVASAWLPQRRGLTIDYGRFAPLLTDGPHLLEALLAWYADIVVPGFAGHQPDLIYVDAGWETDYVDRFCKRIGLHRAKPIHGYSQTNPQFKNYHPKTTGRAKDVIRHDRHRAQPTWHELRLQGGRRLVELDADHWKRHVHTGHRLPQTHPGALQLFNAPPDDHLHAIPIDGARTVPGYAYQLCAEREIYSDDKGCYLWTANADIAREPHYLDATAYAAAAADACGWLDPRTDTGSAMATATKPSTDHQPAARTTRDGRPMMIHQR